MQTSTSPQVTRFLDNASSFSAVVGAVSDWRAPSPCQGWSAADVVAHVVDTQRDFLAQHGFDVGPRPEGDPAAVWRRHLESVTAWLEDEQRVTAEYDGYFGPTTVGATLADFYGFDLVIHRWDLGRAAGQPVTFTASRWTPLRPPSHLRGRALRRRDLRPPGAGPDDAPRQDRLLATLGRQP
jgi:uncharacterized protein (TIGR03086 family)